MIELPEMACREFVERVTDYFEDDMSLRDRKRFEAHLEECPHCALYLDQMRTTLALTGQLREDDVPSEGQEQLLDVFRRWRDGRA